MLFTSKCWQICTAAFAGSIIGIAYERLGNHNKDNNNQLRLLKSKLTDNDYYRDLLATLGTPLSVEAKVQSRQQGDTFTIPSYPSKDKDSLSVLKDLPPVDPQISSQNFKLSSQYGLPSTDNLRIFNDFILSYDRRLRSPVWVMEYLTPEKLKGPAKRDGVPFEQDTALHEYFRAKDKDFLNSGYDRGHLAAAANHKSSQSNLEQTFFYSNIVAQDPIFNREGWNKLEQYVRWRTKQSKSLFVISGPLYLPIKARDGNLYVTYRVIGGNHVSVPTHLYKIILWQTKDGGKFFLEAFLMENDKSVNGRIKLDEYRVPNDRLNVIERAAGLIFFDQITRSKLHELQLPTGFKE